MTDKTSVFLFAQQQGYADIKQLPNWNGYEAYEPVLQLDDVSDTGVPYVILVEPASGEIRMSTEQEAFDNLDFMIREYDL